MKLRYNISFARAQAGIALIECLVYVVVFLMLSSAAMCAFYFCMEGSQKLISGTDDIGAALSAGERWRADMRNANGVISIEKTTSGEVIKIPEGGNQIVYSFDNGEIRRLIDSQSSAKPLLPEVKLSEMTSETRGDVKSWRWELELAQHRKDAHLRLLFTFEAAQKTP